MGKKVVPLDPREEFVRNFHAVKQNWEKRFRMPNKETWVAVRKGSLKITGTGRYGAGCRPCAKWYDHASEKGLALPTQDVFSTFDVQSLSAFSFQRHHDSKHHKKTVDWFLSGADVKCLAEVVAPDKDVHTVDPVF